jgi:hypothetical protein
MKKFLLGFALLLSIGAGCLPIANKTVDGKWALTFDLPAGWTMLRTYDTGSNLPVSEEVKRDDASVYLQDTKDRIAADNKTATKVEATVLDSHRVVSTDEMTDLGNGFYKDGDTAYYLVTEKAKYKFTVLQGGENVSKVEGIVKSAREVTHFTDQSQVEVKTE